MSKQDHAGGAAQRYAKALFEVALEKQALEAVAQDMELLAQVCSDPEVGAWLTDPRADENRKAEILQQQLGDKVHPLSGNLLRVLARRKRQAALGQIPVAFQAMVDRHQNRLRGTVETAVALSAEQKSGLESSLGSRLQRDVCLEVQEDPQLLGGVRITLGSTRFDGTVRGRLERLRQRLVDVDLGTR
ncbi:MAG: ATP synthase F1 subunit delta [Planctomycetota bacterium]|nr:MAG: ATP synthase F1 subunit delta [Planctomycetota bacterium]